MPTRALRRLSKASAEARADDGFNAAAGRIGLARARVAFAGLGGRILGRTWRSWVADPAILEQELGAVGHVVPDGGQLGSGRFRVGSNPRDGLVELEAELVHVVEIEQIRRDHGLQHGVGLVDRIAPDGRVDAGRHDLLERIDRRDDMRCTIGGSLTIVCSPSLEGEVQAAPGEEHDDDRDDHEPPAGVASPSLCHDRDRRTGVMSGSFPACRAVVESELARRITKPVVLAVLASVPWSNPGCKAGATDVV